MHDNIAIPEKDRVPNAQKICYGLGGLSDFFIPNIVQALFIFVFAVEMRLDPLRLGFVLAATKVVSALADPFVGVISDKTRSRWGRRKPFILIFGSVCGLMMPLVWMIPDVSENMKFVYIFITMSLYFFFHSLFSVPYKALGFELPSNYAEKTKVFAWKKYIEMIGFFMAAWFYWFTQRDVFGGVTNGVVVLGIILGIIVILCAFSVFKGNHEIVEKQALNQDEKIPVFKALKSTFSNKSFLCVQGAILFVILGMGVDATIGGYLHVHYTCAGDDKFASEVGGVGGTVSTIIIFIALPVAVWISRHWGKREAAIMGVSVLFLGALMIPWMMNPNYPWLIIVVWGLSQFGAQSSNLIYGSMMADVCDEDELITGERREGSYAAASSFMGKIAEVAVLLLSGLMPRLAGYTDTSVDPSLEQLQTMKTLLFSTDIIGIGAALFLLFFYPLSREKCDEIQDQLKALKEEKGTE